MLHTVDDGPAGCKNSDHAREVARDFLISCPSLRRISSRAERATYLRFSRIQVEKSIRRLSIVLTRNGSGMLDGVNVNVHISLVHVTCTTSKFESEYRTPRSKAFALFLLGSGPSLRRSLNAQGGKLETQRVRPLQ
jgi:hypothetical protein